jgi:hypothetical protein
MHKILQNMMATITLFFLLMGPITAGGIHGDVPENPDTNTRYLIYLHDAWPVISAVSEPHRRHGIFEYEDILEVLANEDFEVFFELRRNRFDPRRYAHGQVVTQVAALNGLRKLASAQSPHLQQSNKVDRRSKHQAGNENHDHSLQQTRDNKQVETAPNFGTTNLYRKFTTHPGLVRSLAVVAPRTGECDTQRPGHRSLAPPCIR